MKFTTRLLTLGAVLATCIAQGNAQTTYSGYFLDNYTYRFQMNPAFGNEKNFVSFPALGNLNLAFRGNLNLSDVIYSRDGRTMLFTNPMISAAEVMGNVGDKNRLGTNNKLDILSVGFKGFGGYNTVSIGAVVNANVSVPGSFFSLAKEGITNKTYDIKNLFGYADAYAQIALNHSREIKQVPGLRVGAAVKFLIGAGAVDFKFNRAELSLGQDSWSAVTNADIYASLTGFRFDHDVYDVKRPVAGEPAQREYVSGGNLDDGFGLNGFGMGFDLGAEYTWGDWHFSAAVLNLGFMAWGKTQWASTNGDQTISTDAYTFNANDDADNSFDNEWDRFTDNLGKLYQLEDKGELSSHTRALAATLNFAADYELPVYRRLHFGLLNSTTINGPYTWTQFRLSANVCPVNWVSADVNMVAGTYGVGFGWLLNFHTTGINFFVGMDHTIGKLSKQFIPLKSNADLNLGINFPF